VFFRVYGTDLPIAYWLDWRWPIPIYFFDIKDGHRLSDRAGSHCKNDAAAFAKAKVLAICVSLDQPSIRRAAFLLRPDEARFSGLAPSKGCDCLEYAMWDGDHKLPTQMPSGRSKCFCGTAAAYLKPFREYRLSPGSAYSPLSG
jgi:hypothetical protein